MAHDSLEEYLKRREELKLRIERSENGLKNANDRVSPETYCVVNKLLNDAKSELVRVEANIAVLEKASVKK